MVRLDKTGAAHAGSQLQTQLYVNRRTKQLDDAIRKAIPDLADTRLEWRSPLTTDGYREYSDAAFLATVDLADHVEALAAFWPKGGPHWDALAVAIFPDDEPGVVLVEGKSYPDEMLKGSPIAATSGSHAKIEQALQWTRDRLEAHAHPDAWTGSLYQNANRLAHLCWLESVGVRAWLVHLLFTGDPHGDTTPEQWGSALAEAEDRLGLTDVSLPNAAHVLLPAGRRAELLA